MSTEVEVNAVVQEMKDDPEIDGEKFSRASYKDMHSVLNGNIV